MIQAFVEKNGRLLSFYYWAAKIGGWVLLSWAVLIAAGKSFALATRIGDWQEFNRFLQHDVPWGAFSIGLPTGLLAIGISQLIWYLIETDHQPGWILRNAYKLLYAYAVILITYYCWMGTTDVISHFNEPYDFPLRSILIALFILVKLLVIVGLAELLRRLLPVMEESRTLV
jgi:hypothetical protein